MIVSYNFHLKNDTAKNVDLGHILLCLRYTYLTIRGFKENSKIVFDQAMLKFLYILVYINNLCQKKGQRPLRFSAYVYSVTFLYTYYLIPLKFLSSRKFSYPNLYSQLPFHLAIKISFVGNTVYYNDFKASNIHTPFRKWFTVFKSSVAACKNVCTSLRNMP